MKIVDIEIGVVYTDKRGNEREVISLENGEVSYKVVKEGKNKRLREGFISKMQAIGFVSWAREVVYYSIA